MSFSASEGIVDEDEVVDILISTIGISSSSNELNNFDVKLDISSSSGPLSLL
jgi:hypothetical protein